MYLSAFCTNKLATVTTEISCNVCLTFLALCLLWFLELLKGILNLEEVVGVKCRLKTRNTAGWKEGGSTAVGAAQGQPLVILDHKSLEAVFTKHMKALEQSGIFVGVEWMD